MATRNSHISNTYDGIAESWYRLRHRTRFEPELKSLAERWGQGRLLNVGCAHGPDFLPFVGRFETWGLDSSLPMIRMAVKYAQKYSFKPNLLVADAVQLPFSNGVFDYVVAVASYHHIPGGQNREQAFQELRRVLKPGGEAFITVWNRWQRDFLGKGREVQVPWKTREKEILRYYYLFTYFEIEAALRQAGLKVLATRPENSYRLPLKYFSRNICVLVKRD
ncbi:MAG: class I SAM-dependent methyltransferase [Dehalococcoidia bacterium]